MYLLKNGHVVDPVTNTDEILDVLIDGRIIKKVAKDIAGDTEATGAEVIECTGLTIAPGLMDAHVHFRDPGFTYKEDIESGAKVCGPWWCDNGCPYGQYQACSR